MRINRVAPRKRRVEVTETVVIAGLRSYDSTVEQFGAETTTTATRRQMDRSCFGGRTGSKSRPVPHGWGDRDLGSISLYKCHSRSSHARVGGRAC
jgi:hypothetical protein